MSFLFDQPTPVERQTVVLLNRKFVDELTGDYWQTEEGVIEKHCSDSRDVPIETHVYTHPINPP